MSKQREVAINVTKTQPHKRRLTRCLDSRSGGILWCYSVFQQRGATKGPHPVLKISSCYAKEKGDEREDKGGLAGERNIRGG